MIVACTSESRLLPRLVRVAGVGEACEGRKTRRNEAWLFLLRRWVEKSALLKKMIIIIHYSRYLAVVSNNQQVNYDHAHLVCYWNAWGRRVKGGKGENKIGTSQQWYGS